MKRYPLRVTWLLASVISVLVLSACATAPSSVQGKADIESDAAVALAKAKKSDPTLTQVFDASAGYAVFPTVGKGAVGVGGAYGKGVLYKDERAVGYCDLSQASIGLQLGGQSYTEIIAFETREAVAKFKQGSFGFDAQATAVALKAGVATKTQFSNGVAVFILDEKGLMLEASVGGQKFSYQGK